MLLAIDSGNTNVVFGVFDGNDFVKAFRRANHNRLTIKVTPTETDQIKFGFRNNRSNDRSLDLVVIQTIQLHQLAQPNNILIGGALW
jgi:pantothenate kinase type III